MKNRLLTQIRYQMQRQLKIKLNDSLNLVVSFIIAPLLALLTALIFRSDPELSYNDSYASFLFFMLIAGVFFGLLSSVFEIIKDKAVIQRERLGRISSVGYFVSKYLTLSLFGLIQVLLFNVVSMWILDIPITIALFNALIMYLLLLISIAMGLWVSALASTTLMASNLIPVLIIPQILLGGLIPYVGMDKLLYMGADEEGNTPPIAKVIPVKYAYEAIVTGNVAFSSSVEEINDNISEMVGFSQRGGFMSMDAAETFWCSEDAFCSHTWSFDIIIMIFYLSGTLLLGYFTFKRKIYDA